MDKKGLILAVIIVVSGILLSILRTMFGDYFNILTALDITYIYIISIGILYFIFSLIFPIILLTQFSHKKFYVNLAFFIIFVNLIILVSSFLYDISEINYYLGFLIGVIEIIGYGILTVMAFKDKELKMISIILILILTFNLYNNGIILYAVGEILGNISINRLIQLIVSGVFANGILLFKVIFVIDESKKMKQRDIELI